MGVYKFLILLYIQECSIFTKITIIIQNVKNDIRHLMLSSPSCVRTFVLRSYTHGMTYRWFCWGTAYLKEKNISNQYHRQIQYCPSPLPAGDLEPAGCVTNVTNKRPSSHGLFPHLSLENNYCINYWTKNVFVLEVWEGVWIIGVYSVFWDCWPDQGVSCWDRLQLPHNPSKS